jgi:alkylation response protein AidB-like acyl-CoA dehydrogenase
MFSELEAARMLAFYAADTIDNDKNAIRIASMAKVKASEAACHLAVEAMHMMGNIGFIASSEMLTLLQRGNDSRVKGGTNRLQQSQIYGYMLAKK